MKEFVVGLEESQYAEAVKEANRIGISLREYIRRSISQTLLDGLRNTKTDTRVTGYFNNSKTWKQ